MQVGPQKVTLNPGDVINSKINTYTVLEKIGEGGFGLVCKVNNQGKGFALKLTKMWDFMPNERLEYAKRFRQEFEYGKNLASEYVVRSHDFDLLEGNPYMVMDYCENGCLRDRFSPSLIASEVDRVAIGILKGLSSLHSEGIIHRDIKPENILFDTFNNPKLVDFGISASIKKRHTQANFLGHAKEIFATCVYSPPEQMDFTRAMKVMGNTNDIYAFGATMYEWLTNGNFPFGDSDEFLKDIKAFESKRKKMLWDRDLLNRLAPHPKWVSIIERCLQYDPRHRFQHCNEIIALIGVPGKIIENPVPNMQTNPNGEWKLIIKNGEDIGRVFHLNRLSNSYNTNSLKIGWLNPNKPFLNEIELAEEFTNYISQFHATLEYDPVNHRWFIRDGQNLKCKGEKFWKSSTNGVIVNSRPIGVQPRELQMGDIIIIGDTTLKMEVN